VKNLKYLCLGLLVASLLAIPAGAQGKKGTRNNNGANEPHGQARAEEVQRENKKGDKDQKGGKKTHKGWAHSHHGGKH
jgi:hypothetical protein